MSYKSALAGAVIAFVAVAPLSVRADTLIGDVITGSYYYPCSTCLYSTFTYSNNPFVVDGTVETRLNVDNGTAIFDVNFNADSLILTSTTTVTFNGASFNGPEFNVNSGNSFSSVSSFFSSNGEFVDAYVLGGTLFVSWNGSFSPGDFVQVEFSAVPGPVAGAGLPSLVLAGGLLAWWRARRKTK